MKGAIEIMGADKNSRAPTGSFVAMPDGSLRHAEEHGWLVEMNDRGPKYYCCEGLDEECLWGGFDPDPSKALRFARKQDAELTEK